MSYITPTKSNYQRKSTRTYVTQQEARRRFICNQPEHVVSDCDEFLSSSDRIQLLKKHKICIYCTKHKYTGNQECFSRHKLHCDICQKNHMTLLHQLNEDKITELTTISSKTLTTTLPTAITRPLGNDGNESSIRCLVGMCAERTHITNNIAKALKLKIQRVNMKVSVLNGMVWKVLTSTTLQLRLSEMHS